MAQTEALGQGGFILCGFFRFSRRDKTGGCDGSFRQLLGNQKHYQLTLLYLIKLKQNLYVWLCSKGWVKLAGLQSCCCRPFAGSPGRHAEATAAISEKSASPALMRLVFHSGRHLASFLPLPALLSLSFFFFLKLGLYSRAINAVLSCGSLAKRKNEWKGFLVLAWQS